MPWVFLLAVSVGGKLAGFWGYIQAGVLVAAFYFSRIDIVKLTFEIVFNDRVINIFGYLLVTLVVALWALLTFAHKFDKCTLRKLFHLLALVLFMPILLQVHESKHV